MVNCVYRFCYLVCILCWWSSVQTLRVGLVDYEVWVQTLQTELYNQKITPIEFVPFARPSAEQSLVQRILQARKFMKPDNRKLQFDVIMGGIDFAIETACSDLGVPYYDLDTNHTASDGIISSKYSTLFSMAMPDRYFANATLAILRRYGADKVAIIVDETADYRGFLQTFFSAEDLAVKVFTLHSRTDRKSFLKSVSDTLKTLRQREYTHFIVRTNNKLLSQILAKARYLAMVAQPHMWYFPSTVCEDFGWRDFQEIKTNFSFINEICYLSDQQPMISLKQKMAQLAVRSAHRTGWTSNITAAREILMNSKVDPKSMEDDSAPPVFDDHGERTNVHLEVVTLLETGLVKIGHYRSHPKLSPIHPSKMIGAWVSASKDDSLHFHPPNMHNFTNTQVDHRPKHVVVGMEEHPFLIKQPSKDKNKTIYKGFGVDLLNALCKRLNFTYEIYTVDEQGEQHKDGKWSGMIGQLLEGKAAMAIGPLVQMMEREDVIDFTTPFKNREISLVMKKTENKLTFAMFFQFLSPFEYTLWVCIGFTIALLSFTLYFLESTSAKFWSQETDFSLKECMWFIFCTAIQGGTELIPRSVPGRIMTGAFYFFTLIMISSYTANLAAFLTVKNLASPITSVEQLQETEILKRFTFGTVNESGVLEFFQHSKLPKLVEVHRQMSKVNPKWLVKNSAEGFKRVREGFEGKPYVFIWDDAVNQYEVYTEDPSCNLTVVGRPFGKRSYGIGVPQNSVYKERLNKEILDLQAKNDLQKMEHRWWTANAPCSVTGSNKDSGTANNLAIFEMAGVFLVLAGGIIIALLVLVLEKFVTGCIRKHKTRKQSSQERREPEGSNNHMIGGANVGATLIEQKNEPLLEKRDRQRDTMV